MTPSQGRGCPADPGSAEPGVLVVDGEGRPGRAPGQVRRVAPPGQERDEPREGLLGWEPGQPGGPRSGELDDPGLLVLGPEVGEGTLDGLPIQSPGPEPARDRPAAGPADEDLVLDGLSRERVVVDQTDGLQTDQLGLDLLCLEPGADEPASELALRPRANREEAKRALVAIERVLGDAARTTGPGQPFPLAGRGSGRLTLFRAPLGRGLVDHDDVPGVLRRNVRDALDRTLVRLGAEGREADGLANLSLDLGRDVDVLGEELP